MKISNLSKTYVTKYETVNALDNVNLYLPNSGLVFVVGVSGSGKSTLMNMLSGIDRPTKGNIYIGGEPLFKDDEKQMFGYRNSYVGLIFQDYNLIDDLNVYDNIKLTLELMNRTDYEVVDEVLKQVDIEEIKYSKVNEISSGQMQRVAIARTLVKGSSIILADEPTGNLDSKNEKIIFDLLKEISKERLVVVITHDDDAAEHYSDRIIRIEDGKINADDNPLDKDQSELPEIVEPKIKFNQQVRFTKGFIRNNFGRSLSIFLVLLLIPIIGGILASYAFFNIGTSYRIYQDKYNSNYVMMSMEFNDSDIYYNADELIRLGNTYAGSNFIEQYDTWVDINPLNRKDNFFYQPQITSIIIYNPALELVGKTPEKANEILVTDYVLASIAFYQNKENIKTLTIDDFVYDIVGIVQTDYEKFLDADFSDEYTELAFMENLNIYNSIYTSFTGYFNIAEHMTTYREQISFLVRSDGPVPVRKYANVIVTKNGGQLLTDGKVNRNRDAIVSSAFYYDIMG